MEALLSALLPQPFQPRRGASNYCLQARSGLWSLSMQLQNPGCFGSIGQGCWQPAWLVTTTPEVTRQIHCCHCSPHYRHQQWTHCHHPGSYCSSPHILSLIQPTRSPKVWIRPRALGEFDSPGLGHSDDMFTSSGENCVEKGSLVL